MNNLKTPPPLSLYVHFPWCVRKCPYCDFNSHAIGENSFPESEYIDALIRDLEFSLPQIWGRRITSVFFGGGTPSLFSVEGIHRLLSVLRSYLNIPPFIEITLEANPGTVEANRFQGYREAGINRISIGVQSFADRQLKNLGRIHNSEQATSAVEMIRRAGFSNFNIDIMHGLPEQTVDQALNDLRITIDNRPNHISWYQLTIEPNTVFYTQPPALPDQDRLWEIHQAGKQYLIERGFQPYEVSVYAGAGSRCVHNMNYWQFGDYLGIGAGAHGKLTDVAAGTIKRYARHRIPASYIQLAGKPDAVVHEKLLRRDDLVLEFMMNVMRLNHGINPDLFMERTGLPLTIAENRLLEAERRGLIEWQIDTLKPTELGQQYLNDLLQIFMCDERDHKTA